MNETFDRRKRLVSIEGKLNDTIMKQIDNALKIVFDIT